jgi:Zn-dependent protease with chaperone function
VPDAAPTILALQPDSPWVVIVVVSFVTVPVVALLRRLIKRPGGVASGLLLALPLVLPLVAGALYGHPVLPEVAVLRPAIAALQGSGRGLGHLMLLRDPGSRVVIPYSLAGSTGPWLLVLGASLSSVLLLRRLCGWVAVRRLLRRCSTLEEVGRPEVNDTVARLGLAAGLRRAPVVVVLPPGVEGAFTVGGNGGRILLSERLLAELKPRELEAAVAHEVAHLAARDTRLLLCAGLLRDVVAWNPLAHFAYRRLRTDRELEADRRAAALTGRPLAVASSLLRICELMGATRPALRPALRFGVRGRRLSLRVANLIALADGTATTNTGVMPYAAAAALAAALALGVGVRMSGQQDALALVWGAPDSDVARVWTPERNPWDIKARARASRRPRGEQSSRGRFDAPLPPRGALAALESAPAVSERNLASWMHAVSMVARQRGLPPKGLGLQTAQGWRAQPLFIEPQIGSFGVYRMERLTLPARERAP